MLSAIVQSFGPVENLVLQELPDPQPGAHEVLVRVHAAGLNRADLLQLAGKYPPPKDAPQNIPGLEFAGEVVALGAKTTRVKVGQRVFGITAGGAHATHLVAHERMLVLIPANLSYAQAGAVPEAFITAHDALCSQCGMRPGDSVLIHAVGSGVGLAAAQICAANGAHAFGTSRTAEKIARARDYGLQDGITLGPDLSALKDAVARWTNGCGVGIVLDLVGGAYTPASLDVLAIKGQCITLSTGAGHKAEINLATLLSRRATLTGTVLRSRPLEEKIAATEAFARDVVPLLASGRVRPVIEREFPLSEIREAYSLLASNETFGKVVLTMKF